MQEIQAEYQAQFPNINIAFNIAASGTLQHQIEQGAPIDVFISADAEQVQTLAANNRVISQQTLLENYMVLVTPLKGQGITSFQDLQDPKVTQIAMGHPESVPAGKYSQEILTHLKLYPTLTHKLIYTKNVRQVLFYVETGNVDAGFVYVTDAQQSQKVRVVDTAPSTLHSPIRYPVAVLLQSQHPQTAQSFVQFLQHPTAQAIFKSHGFQLPSP